VQLRELSQGIYVSIELMALYKWIETNSFYDDVCGCRHGYLYPQDQLRQSWSDSERKDDMEIVFFYG